MPRPRSIFLCLSAAIQFMAHGASAQTMPTDSLGGKTVHVFLPSPGIDTLWIENLNIPMKIDAQYWYSYTFTHAGFYDYQDGFYFSNPSHNLLFSKSGLGAAEAPRFLLSDFHGSKEIWIIADPTGPATAPPIIMTSAPKTVNILNPWPATAPKLIYGAKTRNMTTVSGHCGWFSALILDTTLAKGHFAEIGGAEAFGKSGFGSTEDYDFTFLFAQKGPALWLNTEDNSWTGTWPNLEGTCQYMLAMTVRDFSQAHPDFDFGSLTGNHLMKGVVQPVLGADHRPVLNPANAAQDPAIAFSHFEDWWATDSTRADPLEDYESCYDLPMSKSNDGLWEYDSYRDGQDHGFWPAEGAGKNRFSETMASCYLKPLPDTSTWVTGGPQRNGNFCAESHASFTYETGQHFAFRGNDDIWVFINGKLVVDLGGVHAPMSDSIDLDKLGLTPNKTYAWDFFQCNREPCGSALRIKTSIYFKQALPLYGIAMPGSAPGSVSIEIWKRARGNGSCASIGTKTDSLKATNLTYQLFDAAGKLVKELANGHTYYGGITIAEPVIALDTSKLIPDSSLTAGDSYRLVAFEAAYPTVEVGVTFRVPSAASVLKRIRVPAEGSLRKPRYRNALGRRVPASEKAIHPSWNR
jgi:fibro-slime domain-containing protein